MRRLPVLLVGSVLLLLGAVRLLQADETRDAGAGVLLGAGLTVLAAWVWRELRDRDDSED